jgi:hypothetical protein
VVAAVGPLVPRVRLQARLRQSRAAAEEASEQAPSGGGGLGWGWGIAQIGGRTEGRLCSAPMARPKATRSTSRMAASTALEPAMAGAGWLARWRHRAHRLLGPKISD